MDQEEALEALYNNIETWLRSSILPKEAFFLPNVDTSAYSFVKTKEGELNLVKKGEKGLLYYHSETSANKEALEWFKGLDLRITEILYVYGIGLGYYYEPVINWLRGDPKRVLIFLEDDLAVIKKFFETKQAHKIITDPQVRLIYFDDLKDREGALETLYWDVVLTQMTVSALNIYEKNRFDIYQDLQHKIIYDAAIKNALVEEYLKYGFSFFRNYYINLLTISESFQGTKLFGKFEGVPGIICGAGPSLEKNVQVLRGLLNKAIVFGGGSALNALTSKGILPHFGIGIDPNPTQAFRLSSNKAYEVPLFYRNRMHYEAFKLIHGPRLYIHGSGGYDIADWFDEKFSLQGDWIDEGHNVVNFGLELAYRMGLNPIILVGVDLAFTDMQAYAKGIVDDTAIRKKEILDTDDFDTSAFLKKDIYGEPIYTLWKWVAESNWIGEFKEAHKDTRIINCTEGGLGMPGVKNMTLKEVEETYLKTNYDLKNRVQGEIASAEMKWLTPELVIEKATEMQESLTRCIGYFKVLIEDTLALEEKLSQEKVPVFLQSGKAALAETELAEEPAYEFILDLFNNIYSRMLSKDLHQIKEKVENNEIQSLKEKCEINLKRLKFLSDVAKVNALLLEEIVKGRANELNDHFINKLTAE